MSIYVVVRHGHRWMSLASVMFDELEVARQYADTLDDATVYQLVEVDAQGPSAESVSVVVGAFTVTIPTDSDAGRAVVEAALGVLSEPKEPARQQHPSGRPSQTVTAATHLGP